MLNIKVNLFQKQKFLLFLKIVLMSITLSITIKSVGLPEKTPFLSKAILNIIEKNPNTIYTYYKKYEATFTTALGKPFSQLNDMGRKIVFATLVAYKLKPYGVCSPPSSSHSLQIDLSCSSLVCSDYVRITYELYRLLHPIAPIKIIFVGWNGGIIENHVQIFTKYTGIPLLLDPTIGLIAKATFDQVASGHKIPSAEMINFYSRNDIDTFFHTVIGSLNTGSYKPSDLLYYFENYQSFLNSTDNRNYWATPQATSLHIQSKELNQYGPYAYYISPLNYASQTMLKQPLAEGWKSEYSALNRWFKAESAISIKNFNHSFLIKTSNTAMGYQLISPTFQLNPGTYFLILNGLVLNGGIRIGMAQMQCDKAPKNQTPRCNEKKFISLYSYIDKQFAKKSKIIFIPIELSHTLDIRLVLLNLTLKPQSSLWKIKYITIKKVK
ncbi:hypothetical protein [Coxiella-like endosymbiont]|uniref:hypothetical protein n=1 Tax=Coxiella-like endosymbiont TaxID=1592897 RepID=UPI00272A870D|nr:hypothetical protein [Coxiella-like endosymbiont]